MVILKVLENKNSQDLKKNLKKKCKNSQKKNLTKNVKFGGSFFGGSSRKHPSKNGILKMSVQECRFLGDLFLAGGSPKIPF